MCRRPATVLWIQDTPGPVGDFACAAGCRSSLLSPSGAGSPATAQVIVTLVRIDNGYLVPANDPTFDPSQWETYEVWLSTPEQGVRLVGVHLDLNAQFYQHPTNNSLFPQSESVYATAPSARFDSFIDIPGVSPAQITPVGLFWTPTVFNGSWYALAPTSSLPLLSQGRVRVAQFTVAPGTLQLIDVITQGNATVRRADNSQTISPLDTFLTRPFGSMVVRETGNHADQSLTLDVEWAWDAEEMHRGDDARLRLFFPASRVRGIDAVAGPWTARKALVNGVFGVLAESTFGIDEQTEGSFSLAFTSRAPNRAIRYTGGIGDLEFHPFGYWAPVAPSLLAGDTNDDGVVDFADLNNVLSDFGSAPSSWRTDFDGSGTVDFADLNAVLAAFGSTD